MVPCKVHPDALKQTCFAIYHQVQPSIFPDHLRMLYQAQPNKFVLLQEKKKTDLVELQQRRMERNCKISFFAILIFIMWEVQTAAMCEKDIDLVAECFCWSHQTASGNMKNGIITECILQLIIKLLNVLHFVSLSKFISSACFHHTLFNLPSNGS